MSKVDFYSTEDLLFYSLACYISCLNGWVGWTGYFVSDCLLNSKLGAVQNEADGF